MKDLQLTFAGRQLTDQELETLASWRTDGSGFNIISSEPNSLDYEHAHSANAQDPNSQTYFEDLISRFTSAESLPRFTDNTFGSESISLYGFDADGQPSLPKDALSGEKFALAMRVLPRMMYYNLGVQLQQEMSLMLESKTTNDTQMERVRSLLSQYGNTHLRRSWPSWLTHANDYEFMQRNSNATRRSSAKTYRKRSASPLMQSQSFQREHLQMVMISLFSQEKLLMT